MTTRFELEESIVGLFNILEDMELANEEAESVRLAAVILVWEMKLAKLWDTFESYVHDLNDKDSE